MVITNFVHNWTGHLYTITVMQEHLSIGIFKTEGLDEGVP